MDWIEDRLPVEDRAALAQAVEADPLLQERAAWLRRFLGISRQLVLADPPEDVRRSARASFAAYAQARRPPGVLQRLSAALASDNWQKLSLAGVRNVTLHTAPRQLIYTSDLADVALNLRLDAGGQQIDLAGQVFPLDDSDPAGFVVQLLQDDVERGLVACDAIGKFSLVGLPAGAYALVVSGDQGDIELGPIEVA
jgi:hypothetical protein